jgi:hypothetical protein
MESVVATVVDTPNEEESVPLQAPITHHCFAAVILTQVQQIYTDQTGHFPFLSSWYNSQSFLLYDYDNRSITLCRPNQPPKS